MKKSTQQSLKHGAKMIPKMERNHGRCSGRRRTLRPRWAREAVRDPKATILAPKMSPQSLQNGNQDPPADTENAHKRPMLKSRIQNLQGHSKEDLRRKRCCASVPRSVFNPPQHLRCCRACKTRCHNQDPNSEYFDVCDSWVLPEPASATNQLPIAIPNRIKK